MFGGMSSIAPNAMTSKIAPSGYNTPQMNAYRGIASSPMGAMQTAFNNPMTVGIPLVAGAAMAFGGGQKSSRPTDNSGPKDRPAGGYQPRPRTRTPYTWKLRNVRADGPAWTTTVASSTCTSRTDSLPPQRS